MGRGQTGFGQGSLRLGVYLGGGTCRQVATSKLYQAALNDLWLEKAVHRLLRYPAKGRYYAAPLARRNVPVVHRTALRNFAVAAGAKRPGAAADIIIERLAALPGPERTIALEQLFLLQSKVSRALPSGWEHGRWSQKHLPCQKPSYQPSTPTTGDGSRPGAGGQRRGTPQGGVHGRSNALQGGRR